MISVEKGYVDAPVDESLDLKKEIEKLKKERLVDDQYFTEWYIDQRNTFRPRSNLMLKQELLSKVYYFDYRSNELGNFK